MLFFLLPSLTYLPFFLPLSLLTSLPPAIPQIPTSIPISSYTDFLTSNLTLISTNLVTTIFNNFIVVCIISYVANSIGSMGPKQGGVISYYNYTGVSACIGSEALFHCKWKLQCIFLSLSSIEP